jgi:hypothetical protein
MLKLDDTVAFVRSKCDDAPDFAIKLVNPVGVRLAPQRGLLVRLRSAFSVLDWPPGPVRTGDASRGARLQRRTDESAERRLTQLQVLPADQERPLA